MQILRPFLCVLTVLLPCFVYGIASAAPTTLVAGIKITSRATFKSGVYHLTDTGGGIVQISGSNFTVDFKGTHIVGPGAKQGIGILVADARNVTIKNADVSGCLWGIVVERSVKVNLDGCNTSWNADLPPGTVIDESGHEPEDNHGGGILLRDSRECQVQRCLSQHQWDGIDVVRSQHNVIEEGDFSFNGNWGVHFWNSSNNRFLDNKAVWCTTGSGLLYQALTGWQTYDAQAVGIDHDSNENVIEGNDLRFGGDGIFIRANEGPIEPGTVVPPRNGSHRNVLRNNDCSFSPNNAIEVDLVDDTIIEGNNCSFSNYGMWLGYSRRCIVRNNICISDSTHAVEIENGQDDLFENNIMGFDTPRPNGQLIYLRYNGRDKTPSGPYTLRNNVFYGAGTALLLTATKADFIGNTLLIPKGSQAMRAVVGDAASVIQESETHTEEPRAAVMNLGRAIKPGSLLSWKGSLPKKDSFPPVMEVEGIPLWRRMENNQEMVYWMPDFWDRPAKDTVQARIFSGTWLSDSLTVPVLWPADQPRIISLSPNPARIGDTVTVEGMNLGGGRILLNGRPATIVEATPNRMTLKLAEGILVPTHYNLVWERGEGAQAERTWPITFSVQVPQEQMPHLVSASFSPTTLHVGEVLKVTMTVRNNLPTPAPLTTRPAPIFTYQEKQACYEMGFGETPGKLHLRVSTDFRAGGHDPGSWPWLFGFGQEMLAPGETASVEGYIKVETPGVHEFRIGLVAGGFRFIDDNAYRTKITVLP